MWRCVCVCIMLRAHWTTWNSFIKLVDDRAYGALLTYDDSAGECVCVRATAVGSYLHLFLFSFLSSLRSFVSSALNQTHISTDWRKCIFIRVLSVDLRASYVCCCYFFLYFAFISFSFLWCRFFSVSQFLVCFFLSFDVVLLLLYCWHCCRAVLP